MKKTKSLVSENVNPLIVLVQQRFNLWLQRDLSIIGRSLVAKIEGISRLVYAAMELDVSKEICTKIDRIFLKLFGKREYIILRKMP